MSPDLDQIIELLRHKGERITAPRRWTLRILLEQRGHLTIEQIHQQLTAHGVHADEATVYRTLQWLKDNGIVAQTDVGQGADIYSLLDEDPHHHLICLNCGETILPNATAFTRVSSISRSLACATSVTRNCSISCEDAGRVLSSIGMCFVQKYSGGSSDREMNAIWQPYRL